ncbi:hypothetical protein [Undibacterium pigrum]|uniref:Uncharacterized protein n=1 Tax=Undibacterium pigrum TaxID=401470 RepID=A0A318IP04_9BURK|nr:hypothetical protein [Undibacterium pigrum]PXX37776.1 hypothetical protein DFR42_11526 [Undibacterium pigrum]
MACPGYTLQAVINGIMLPAVSFGDDNASITAVTVEDDPVAGVYKLDVVQSKN